MNGTGIKAKKCEEEGSWDDEGNFERFLEAMEEELEREFEKECDGGQMEQIHA